MLFVVLRGVNRCAIAVMIASNDTIEKEFRTNEPLGQYCTLGVGGSAQYYINVDSIAKMQRVVSWCRTQKLPLFVLGSGSNVVISDAGVEGVTAHLAIDQITVTRETIRSVDVRVEAGRCWDDFVVMAVKNRWWGIENLSGIPGTVGAFPVQNVGAYGQDASQVVTKVEVLDQLTNTRLTLSNNQCAFGYRSSIFNRPLGSKYVILAVHFRLRKYGHPNLEYWSIRDRYLKTQRSRGLFQWIFFYYCLRFVGCFSPKDLLLLRRTVLEVRASGCLPDLKQLGNVGSFFQAAYISADDFDTVKKRLIFRFPESAHSIDENVYELGDGRVKISPAWLMRLVEVNKMVVGGASVYENNPAVVINRNGLATSSDIVNLADAVCSRVYEMTGLIIRIEPVFVGFNSLGTLCRFLANGCA